MTNQQQSSQWNNLERVAEFLHESNAIEDVFGREAEIGAQAAWMWLSAVSRLDRGAILGAHSVLMKGLDPGIAGRVRDVNVRVGRYLCPAWDQVPRLMDAWIMNHARASTEDTIKRAHIAFEKIHPFRDGNGRIGRIIMNWQRAKAGLPILVIHRGAEQQEYYKWFR